MIKLIALSGRIESGKNTVADMINDLTGGIYAQKAFAYKVKLIASIMLGVPVAKFEDRDFKDSRLVDWGMTVRQFLQKLGTDAIRDGLHTNAWVKALFAEWKGDPWVITDCRFDNEAYAVWEKQGVNVRLTKNSDKEASHESETALDDFKFDYVIDNANQTLDETREAVEEMLKHFRILN